MRVLNNLRTISRQLQFIGCLVTAGFIATSASAVTQVSENFRSEAGSRATHDRAGLLPKNLLNETRLKPSEALKFVNETGARIYTEVLTSPRPLSVSEVEERLIVLSNHQISGSKAQGEANRWKSSIRTLVDAQQSADRGFKFQRIMAHAKEEARILARDPNDFDPLDYFTEEQLHDPRFVSPEDLRPESSNQEAHHMHDVIPIPLHPYSPELRTAAR